jgi:hypothetical protein
VPSFRARFGKVFAGNLQRAPTPSGAAPRVARTKQDGDAWCVAAAGLRFVVLTCVGLSRSVFEDTAAQRVGLLLVLRFGALRFGLGGSVILAVAALEVARIVLTGPRPKA